MIDTQFIAACVSIESHIPEFPESDQHVTRLIHQIYTKGFASLPIEFKENIQKLKRLNPGWEHRFYDSQSMEVFIFEHYGADVLAMYTRIDPAYGAARADLFRYLCVYHFGGVYLDIKSTIDVPLDSSIKNDDMFLLSQWDSQPGSIYAKFGRHKELQHVDGGEYQIWHIVAAPGHPYLKQVIQKVLENVRSYNPFVSGTGRRGVLRTTGPIAYTLAIAPVIELYPHRIVDVCKEYGFRSSIFDAGSATNAHRAFMGLHYSKNRHPVVRQTGWRRLVWRVLTLLRGRGG